MSGSLAARLIAGSLILTLWPAAAGATVSAIGPFTGHRTDTFDQYTTNMAVQELPVFGGAGVIRNLSTDGSIKVEFSSSLNGDLVVPISGMMIGQLGIADWVFTSPAVRFGGFWENNSGANDATVSFYNADNDLLATLVANVSATAQQWQWNGWESQTPFTRVHVVGNGLINGFIWYENMQLTFVPEPVGSALSVFGGVVVLRRRRGG